MQPKWNDNQPIYRQLRDHVIARILDGDLTEGDALPSVRAVSVEFQLNPITVSKAYQTLVDENLIEKRRGLGMFVRPGAFDRLLASEREQFLAREWPELVERMQRMNLEIETLLAMVNTDQKEHNNER